MPVPAFGRPISLEVSDAPEHGLSHRHQRLPSSQNLEELFREDSRNSTSLEIINVVFAGSLAFSIMDRLTGGSTRESLMESMAKGLRIRQGASQNILPCPAQFLRVA